jgi:hypothetical protein
MQSSLKVVDCVIEVHDARISFHGVGVRTAEQQEAFLVVVCLLCLLGPGPVSCLLWPATLLVTGI